MRDQIVTAMKEALKSGDKKRTGTLRLVNAAITDKDIANRGNGKDPASNEDVLDILLKMVKQREESVRMYEEGDRQELAEQERLEIEIIREFLPKMLSDDDAKVEIKKLVEETGAASIKDMGKVMGLLKARFQGKIDMGRASGLIKELLG